MLHALAKETLTYIMWHVAQTVAGTVADSTASAVAESVVDTLTYRVEKLQTKSPCQICCRARGGKKLIESEGSGNVTSIRLVWRFPEKPFAKSCDIESYHGRMYRILILRKDV